MTTGGSPAPPARGAAPLDDTVDREGDIARRATSVHAGRRRFRPARRDGAAGTRPAARRADDATHRCRQHQRLAVDADRDLGASASTTTSVRGQPRTALTRGPERAPTASAGAADRTASSRGRPPSRRAASAEAGGVVRAVRVVADQHGLRARRRRAPPCDPQARAARPASRSGSMSQRRAALVVAVGRALHDLGVGAEGRVVDEGAAVDRRRGRSCSSTPSVQRVEAAGRVLAVEPEVQREVVARAGARSPGTARRARRRPRRPGPACRPRRRRRAGRRRRRRRVAGELGDVDGRGRRAARPRRPARGPCRTRSNRPTFPPPDFGFMIRNGWRGGGVEYSVGAWSATSSSNAAREAAADAAHRAASTTTTQSRPARTKPTSMRTGAATRSTPARTRATPRWVRNHQAPTRTAATAATATSTRPRLPRIPAAASGSTTAPTASSSASRESHRDRPLARPTAVSDVAGTVRSSVMSPPLSAGGGGRLRPRSRRPASRWCPPCPRGSSLRPPRRRSRPCRP